MVLLNCNQITFNSAAEKKLPLLRSPQHNELSQAPLFYAATPCIIIMEAGLSSLTGRQGR